MQCEMCGSDSATFETRVEGAILSLCTKCSKYGKVVKKIRPVSKKQIKTKKISLPEEETIFVLVPDYANKVKQKREKMGLKQDQLANRLNERVSIISKIESGSFEPSIKLARKLERFLKINLVEEHKEDSEIPKKTKGTPTTIGDLIKLKQ